MTPSATPFFKRAYKISHPPGLKAPWGALPSFTSSAQSAKIHFESPILALYAELGKLSKASQDAYNPGGWLIL